MNAAPFPGNGMSHAVTHDLMSHSEPEPDAGLVDAVDAALSEPIPPATSGDRAIFEKSIAARRAEKAKQQAIAAAALAKCRQLTASIRSMEDALDGLLVSEVAP